MPSSVSPSMTSTAPMPLSAKSLRHSSTETLGATEWMMVPLTFSSCATLFIDFPWDDGSLCEAYPPAARTAGIRRAGRLCPARLRGVALSAPIRRALKPWISTCLSGSHEASVFLLQLFVDPLDLPAERRVDLLVALLRKLVVVDADYVHVVVRANAAVELDRHLGGGPRRALDAVLRHDRKQPPFHRDALAALGEQELDESARRLRVLGARQDRGGAGGDPRRLRRHVLDVEAREAILEGEVARDCKAHGELTLRHQGGYVAAARHEDAGVRRQALENFPALRVAFTLQNHFVRGVAAGRSRRRYLGDISLEPWIEEVVPVLRRRHAQALQEPGVIRDAAGFEHRAHPEALRVLERDRLRLPDRLRNAVGDRLRQLERREEALLREPVEKRAFPAPEEVGLRSPVPLNDAPIRDRRARGERACLHVDVPALLGLLPELRKRRVGEALPDRRDEDELVLDRLPGERARCGEQSRERRRHHFATPQQDCPQSVAG